MYQSIPPPPTLIAFPIKYLLPYHLFPHSCCRTYRNWKGTVRSEASEKHLKAKSMTELEIIWKSRLPRAGDLPYTAHRIPCTMNTLSSGILYEI